MAAVRGDRAYSPASGSDSVGANRAAPRAGKTGERPVASEAFSHLLSPLALRHTTLKNRIVFGAHTANMAEDGLPGARHLAYYAERARGGDGRVYTITVICTDAAGNAATNSAEVSMPHDQGKKNKSKK